MNKTFIFIYLFIFLNNPTFAYVYGGTNFSYSGYPESNCYLYSNSDEWQRESYIRCINEYVENASNDIKRIKEKAKETIDEAERKLKYNY